MSDKKTEPEMKRVWAIIEEIGRSERHFNEIQSKYRNLTSIWLLAFFGAIGFLLSADVPAIDDYKFLSIAGLSLVTAFGISNLWILDLIVYQRLLDASFIEGLKLEEQNNWLPKVRHNMMIMQGGRGKLFSRVLLFYYLPIFLALCIGGTSISWELYLRDYKLFLIPTFLAIAIGLLVYLTMARSFKKTHVEKIEDLPRIINEGI